MGQISKQIIFDTPLEKVWKVWTDVERTPEWVEGVSASKITSSVREGKGLAWNEKCVFGKQEIQMDHKFIECEPLKKTVTETGLPMGGSMQTVAEFKSNAGGGTQANLQVEWDLGIVGAMIGEDKLQHMVEKSFNATIEKWKTKAEKG